MEVWVPLLKYPQSNQYAFFLEKKCQIFSHFLIFLFIFLYSATLVFDVELVACRPRKGSSISTVTDEKARLE
jgi:hypothetical protein